jgi:hypothetical protein
MCIYDYIGAEQRDASGGSYRACFHPRLAGAAVADAPALRQVHMAQGKLRTHYISSLEIEAAY